MSMFTQLASDQLFKRLDKISAGSLSLVTPDGKTRTFEGKEEGCNVSLELRDWRVITNMARKGDIGFAEDYRAGKWDTNDLTSLITFALDNRSSLDGYVTGSKLSRMMSVISYLLRINTLRGSKKNIHAHYDLGNDFYKLWLDPTMTYSAAIFNDHNEPLQQAQHNKYDRMIDCLDASSGNILEIGCGWGGFAERATQKGDFRVKGITLSEEQHAYAQRRMGDKADIVLEDYRNQNGTFNNIVSIEMFEAVGERYWPTYFTKLGSLLDKKGKAVIQTITMNEDDFPRYRRGGDFIRSYIFPGGMLPAPSRFRQEAQKAGLQSYNEYYFGQDYARTMVHWLKSFDDAKDKVLALGFDDGFVRLWRFYLAACIAGFKTGRTDVMQVEVSHA